MSLAYYIAAAIIIGAGLFTLRRYRKTPTPAMRAFIATLFILAAAFTVLANATRPIIDALINIQPFARWLGNSLTLAAGSQLLLVLVHFARRPTDPQPRPRRYLAAVAAASAVMAACVIGTPDSDDFIDVHATDTRVSAYLLVYLGSLGLIMAVALISGIRYAIRSTSWMRAAMIFVATGGGFGVTYSIYKVSVVIARHNGDQLGTESILGPALGLASALLITVGSTIGTVGPTATLALRYRRLAPLHAALAEAFPQIQFDTEIRDLRYRLDRRIVEIRDAQVLLRPWSDRAQASAKAALLDQQYPLPTVQAMILTAALQAKAAGEPPADPSPEWTGPGPTTPSSLEEEALYLARIARAFTRLPANAQLPHITQSTESHT